MRSTKKISIDFSDESYVLLDQTKLNYFRTNGNKISNSFIVNLLMDNVLGCDAELKNDIINSLENLKGHYNLTLLTFDSNSFLAAKYKTKIETVTNLISLFNKYNIENRYKKNMKRVKMSGNRVAVFPSDWVILNQNDAPSMTEVYVVECRNHDNYNIPHFVYFGDETAFEDNDYSTVFKDKLYKMILSVYPDFKIVLDNQIDLIIYDGKIMNSLQYEQSPIIGIFKIINSKELNKMREFDKRYKPPYDAVIEIE